MTASKVHVEEPEALPWSSAELVGLGLLMALASVLRLDAIGAHSLWLDELLGWRQAISPSIQELLSSVRQDVHPPGQHLIMWAFVSVLGDAEWVLRLPSALAGVLLLPVIQALGRRIFDPHTGLCATALVAVSWCPLYYSQEARPYAFVALFSGLFLLAWWGLMEDVQRGRMPPGRRFTGFILSGAGLLYMHYFGLVFIASTGLLALLVHVRDFSGVRTTALAYGGVVLGFAPWLPELLNDMGIKGSWVPAPGPLLSEIYRFSLFIFGPSKDVWGFGGLAGLVVFGLGLRLNEARRDLRQRREGWPGDVRAAGTLLLLIVIMFSVTYIRSCYWTSVLVPRYLIIALPAIYVLAGFGLASAVTQPRARKFLPVMLVIFGLSRLQIEDFRGKRQRENWRGSAEVLKEGFRKVPGSHQMIVYSWNLEILEYYLSPHDGDWTVALRAGERDHLGKLDAWLNGRDPGPLWFFAGHRKPAPEFLGRLKSRFPRAKWWISDAMIVVQLAP